MQGSQKSTTKSEIIIIEDDYEYRERLVEGLNAVHEWKVSGGFESMESILEEIENLRPDLVLVDIQLPGLSGIDGLPKLKELFPDAQLVMLTAFSDSEKIRKALAAGADGYILKRRMEHIVAGVKEALGGGALLSPRVHLRVSEIARELDDRIAAEEKRSAALSLLTGMQASIMRLVLNGLSSDEIAGEMGLKDYAVKNQRRAILKKLGVNSTPEAIRLLKGTI